LAHKFILQKEDKSITQIQLNHFLTTSTLGIAAGLGWAEMLLEVKAEEWDRSEAAEGEA
jgi:hypothetical protein